MRVFTVGLRSGAFDPAPLRSIAERTGGSYAEARSAAELAAIYEELGKQLAGEYLVRYRSAPARCRRSTSESRLRAKARRRRPTSRRPRRCSRRTTARRSRRSCSRAARRSCSRSSWGCSCAVSCCCSRAGSKTTVVDRVQSFANGPRALKGESAAAVALRARHQQPLRHRLVGAARARPRARADDGDAPAGRGHVARRHVRDLPARADRLGAALGPLRADDPARRPRGHPTEGEGGPRRVRRAVPGQPAGARVGAARRATASTARSASSSTTPASRHGRSWRAWCRTTGSASCPRTRSASSRGGWRTATSSRSRSSPSSSGPRAATRPRSSTPSSPRSASGQRSAGSFGRSPRRAGWRAGS